MLLIVYITYGPSDKLSLPRDSVVIYLKNHDSGQSIQGLCL